MEMTAEVGVCLGRATATPPYQPRPPQASPRYWWATTASIHVQARLEKTGRSQQSHPERIPPTMTSSGSSQQFPSRLRTQCEDYAEKYGYKRKDLGRGFEGYLAHLFARESGFEEALEGQDPQDADLSDVILRTGDLGVDIVLEDSENRQLLLIQAKWSTKSAQYPLDSLQSFLSLHSKLCEQRFIATGGDMARELLGSYADKVRDKYTVVFRFVTNRPLPEGVRWKEIRDSANEDYDKSDARVKCEVFGQAELKELEQTGCIDRWRVSSAKSPFQSRRMMRLSSMIRITA